MCRVLLLRGLFWANVQFDDEMDLSRADGLDPVNVDDSGGLATMAKDKLLELRGPTLSADEPAGGPAGDGEFAMDVEPTALRPEGLDGLGQELERAG